MEGGRNQEQRSTRARRRHDDDDFQRVSGVPNSCSASVSEREMFYECSNGRHGRRQKHLTNGDPECVFIVNGMGLLRRHMKHGHPNKWSPRHKYMSACITNIEIPDEMSVFTGLKTVTEKDSERYSNAFFEGSRLEGRSCPGAEEPLNDVPKQSSNELVR